jgi:hypothetical protein
MRRIVFCAALVAAVLAGCGDDDSSPTATSATAPVAPATVDAAAVEKGMKQQLSTAEVKVTSVKCPEDEQAEPGATFKCSVKWDNGATGKVKVTQGAANRYTYEPVSGSVQVPGAVVEAELQEDLAKQGAPDAQVNCPDNIIVKLDTTVTCNVSGAGGTAGGTVTYTFSSVEGTVDPESVEAGSS